MEALDTKNCIMLKIPVNHIVIDFDIPGEDGKKNFKAASMFPPTYAELSKSVGGIHLYYYNGDVEQIEFK